MTRDNLRIRGLSLMTSLGCNLNCEYCHIAKSRNAHSPSIQKASEEALKDGTFLNNIKKVFQRLEQSPEDVTSLALWGQEPTLTLHHLTNNLEDWFNYFPEVDQLMFSTNSIAHSDRIVDFAKKIDETINHPFVLSVQFSYDGDESTNEIRYADSSTIYKNIVYVITELNKINFKHTSIRLYFHGVISLDLLNRLDSYEKMEQYYSNLLEWCFSLSELNHNSHVELEPTVGLAIENPVDATPEQGMKLAYFVNMVSKINPKHLGYNIVHPTPIETLLQQYRRLIDSVLFNPMLKEKNINNLDELLQYMADDADFAKIVFYHFNDFLYCGNGVHELKIMYDGTLVGCQNQIYDTETEHLIDDGSFDYLIRHQLASHKFFVNPLKDSDADLDRYFDLFKTCKESSFPIMFKTIFNRLILLNKAHQVHYSYNNVEKAMAHAFMLTIFNCCSYNNQFKTGSIFLRHNGFIRFFCNGFMDEIFELSSRF